MSTLTIAAAGESSRLREFMTDEGYPVGFPKHLLPTHQDGEQTLVGRTIKMALESGVIDRVVLLANEDTAPFFKESADPRVHSAEIEIVPKRPSLDYFWHSLIETRKRVYASFGDFYASDNFSWDDMSMAHEGREEPLTFLTGTRPSPIENAAVFGVNDSGVITEVERRGAKPGEHINIGAYIFDPQTGVLDGLRSYITEGWTQDRLVKTFANCGLAAAYSIDGAVLNVNTPETYMDLLAHTNQANARIRC